MGRIYKNVRLTLAGYLLECDCEYEPGYPAITSGPPDNWASEDPSEMYVERLQFVDPATDKPYGPNLFDWIEVWGSPPWENIHIVLEDIIMKDYYDGAPND